MTMATGDDAETIGESNQAEDGDDPRLSVLRGTHLFSDALDAGQLAALAETAKSQRFPAGAVMIREGDRPAAMFAIQSGTVAIACRGRRGRQVAIRSLGPGSVVGEIELLTGEPRLASVEAVTDVEALAISREALDPFFAASPDLNANFASMLRLRRDMLRQMLPDRDGPFARLVSWLGRRRVG